MNSNYLKTGAFLIAFFALLLNKVSAQDSIDSLNANTLNHETNQVRNNPLCQLARNTLSYLELGEAFDPKANHAGSTRLKAKNINQVAQTLQAVCDKNIQTSQSVEQLKQHFNFKAWHPDKAKAERVIEKTKNANKKRLLSAIPDDQILLTKYYTKLVDAKLTRQGDYQHALYALPDDEINLSLAQANQQADKLIRFKYTRQQVMAGALNNYTHIKPILWLTEKSLHDVMLQGTAVFKDGDKTRYFNVHRNNGVAYDYALNKDQQARYWYFKEVPSIMGYGKDANHKIALLPHVTVAGNVKQLGLGKLILLEYVLNGQNVSQLVILADEGGAFDDNLFQLDLLVDSHYGWDDYHKANKHLPDFVSAFILTAK